MYFKNMYNFLCFFIHVLLNMYKIYDNLLLSAEQLGSIMSNLKRNNNELER